MITNTTQALAWAQEFFPELELKAAKIILQELTGYSELDFITKQPAQLPLSSKQSKQFQQAISELSQGKPLAYILGYQYFYGLKLQVSPAVLIPRPDTELIVEQAIYKMQQLLLKASAAAPDLKEYESKPDLKEYKSKPDLKILELGTGSGAISIALMHYAQQTWPQHQISFTATDISAAALQIAQKNAQQLAIKWQLSDWYEQIQEQAFDLIISNPPYIAQDEACWQQPDLHYEPRLALIADHNGLAAFERIIKDAPKFLRQNGWLLLEHGYQQAGAVANLLYKYQGYKVSNQLDLGNNPRVTSAQFITAL